MDVSSSSASKPEPDSSEDEKDLDYFVFERYEFDDIKSDSDDDEDDVEIDVAVKNPQTKSLLENTRDLCVSQGFTHVQIKALLMFLDSVGVRGLPKSPITLLGSAKKGNRNGEAAKPSAKPRAKKQKRRPKPKSTGAAK
jgi:hypothetical protein